MTLQTLEEGAVVTGVVKNLTDYGAFVDLGGLDGLLHVTDMSWSRGVKPAEVVKVGDPLEVKILKVNRETRKISLGLKQLGPDPWTVAAAKYPQGTRVRGGLQVFFTHLNHSNPALDPEGPERRALAAAGFRVLAEGQELEI